MVGGGKTVVIGSGVGGAGVAALLAARGHRVTLLEKNAFLGGKCASFEKDGYIVDAGVHMFSMGGLGPLGEVARKAGGEQDWVYRNPQADWYAGGGARWKHYRGWAGLRGPRALHTLLPFAARTAVKERVAEKTGRGARKLLEREAYRCSREHGLAETLRMLHRAMRLDESVLEELNDVTVQEFFHRFTDDNAALQLVSALCMILMVVPPDAASAGELLYILGRILQGPGCGFPRGASREVPGSFVRSLQKHGGSLELNREAARIVVDGNRVTGVECADGEFFPADVVISNAGIKRTVELAGEDSFPAEYVEYVKGLKYSYSFVTRKWGLGRRALVSPSPCVFSIPYVSADHMFDYIDEGGAPEDPLLFVPVSTEWDPHCAPSGKQLVIMGVPGPIEVNEGTCAQSEAILDAGQRKLFEMFPGMEGAVEWELTQHVAATAAITGKPTGECIGLAQCVGQTGARRPSPLTPVHGLFNVGADAGGRGVGTENAATSAMYVAQLLSCRAST